MACSLIKPCAMASALSGQISPSPCGPTVEIKRIFRKARQPFFLTSLSVLLKGLASAPLTAPMENNIPFLFEHTPRSVGATVDGGVWRGGNSVVSPSAPQQSDSRSSSPTRGSYFSGICSVGDLDLVTVCSRHRHRDPSPC